MSLDNLENYFDMDADVSTVADNPEPDVKPAEENPISEPVEKSGENESAPPVEKESKEKETKNVPYVALKEERTKRQEAEKALAEREKAFQSEMAAMRSAIEKLQPQPAAQTQEAAPPPDYYAEPIEYIKHVNEQNAQQMYRELNSMREAMNMMAMNSLKSQHQDFEDVVKLAYPVIQGNTVLQDQLKAMSPAQAWPTIYQIGKQIDEVNKFGGYQQAIEAARKDERERVLAEVKGVPNFPASQSNVRTVGGNTTPESSKEDILEDFNNWKGRFAGK